MAANFDYPAEMAALRQYCVRVKKRPFVRAKDSQNKYVGTWKLEDGNTRLTLSEAMEAARKPVMVWDDERKPVDGIGFLVERSTPDIKKPLGGDLDCCRDPLTGAASPWATEFLQKVRPFRTEVSLSECGFRYFVYGHLPDGSASVSGYGPQADQPEEIRERILTAKPKAREKWEKGNPTFNGFELYEDERHLTLTGEALPELCYPPEDRTDAIKEALMQLLPPAPDATWLNKMCADLKKGSGGRLPALSILDVIDTHNFTESGGQLSGPHPTEGSSTGRNLVIDPSKGVWAYMHDKQPGTAPGGDAWTWLACECGAVKWEEAGAGALKDRAVFEKTVAYAIEKGYVKAEDIPERQPDKPMPEEISEDDLLKIKIPENPRFKTDLEPDNFIQGFIRYGETVTDSYQDYWFAGGLFCLSVTVNRNIVIKLRQGPIYPNVWISNLGLSSLARKSTAMDKVDLTIAAANIDPSCKMPDEFSPEAMIEMLDRQPRAYMLKDESAGLLAVMRKDYMRGLKDALMQLYDGKDINRELRTSRRKSDKTSFQVKNPYLNMMLATTPGSFAANTELLDVISGWLPRFLHFFPNHAKDRWLPLEEGVQENDLLSAECHARLIHVKNLFYDLPEPRVMHLSDEAAAYFISWQRIRERELIEAKDDRLAQFYSRLAVYALKMAMLFTIGRADYADGMKISPDHMQEACRLVDEYFMPMALTVADLVGKAADKNLMDKIVSVLTSRGGKLKRRDLIRAVHARKWDLDDCLEALQESGEVQVVSVSNRQGSPTIWITLSPETGMDKSVTSVPSVKADILSHTKKLFEEGGGKEPGRQYDTCDTLTLVTESPADNDSSNATPSQSMGEDGSEEPPAAPARIEELPKEAQPAREAPTSEKIRAAAIMEYGIAGWVDPVKLSQALKLPCDEVTAWLQDNYEPYNRPGGGVGYRQHRAGGEARA